MLGADMPRMLGPDIVMDRAPAIREYVASMVLGKPDWWFWWD
jgi:hypothetical protein